MLICTMNRCCEMIIKFKMNLIIIGDIGEPGRPGDEGDSGEPGNSEYHTIKIKYLH